MRRSLAALGAKSVERLCVVDGTLLLRRSYHAIPELTNTEGRPVQAAFGFARAILKFHRQLPSTYTAVAFDASHAESSDSTEPGRSDDSSSATSSSSASASTTSSTTSCTHKPRRSLLPGYKQSRLPPPGDLRPQFELAHALCMAVQLPVLLSPPGSEADDVIASCVVAARAAGIPSIVVTADKDLMQLVSDEAPQVSLAQPNQLRKLWGEREVCAAFKLSRVAQLGDLLALAGDSCDDVPGVPGIGPKIAARLLEAHGDLEGVLAAAMRGDRSSGAIGPMRCKALCEHADLARRYREVVALRTDIKIPPLQKLRWQPPANLADLLAARGSFPSLKTELEATDSD